MQVILTEDIPKLGDAGDVVRVKDGYGRNFLLPRGMALLATPGRVRELGHKKQVVAEKQRKDMGRQQGVAQQISGLEFEFEVRASTEGKLFGSVTNADIAERLHEKGFKVDRRKIELSDPIKQVGEYPVAVRLHREVTAEVTVRVTSVDAPPPEEEAEQAEKGVEPSAEEDEQPDAG
jgi:large subunit ribosomal protein L9